MSLAGIAISIGVLVDSSIVMSETLTHCLHERFGDRADRSRRDVAFGGGIAGADNFPKANLTRNPPFRMLRAPAATPAATLAKGTGRLGVSAVLWNLVAARSPSGYNGAGSTHRRT